MLKNFVKFLGVEAEADEKETETESVRSIIDSLDQMDPADAHYTALFASILSRVAHADLHMSEEETRAIEQIVMKQAHLSEAQAVIVTEVAKNQNKLLGGVENYLITREFANWSKREQRFELMDALFAVAAAEAGISTAEDQEISKIADEIGLVRSDYLAIRSKYRSDLNVLKDIPK